MYKGIIFSFLRKIVLALTVLIFFSFLETEVKADDVTNIKYAKKSGIKLFSISDPNSQVSSSVQKYAVFTVYDLASENKVLVKYDNKFYYVNSGDLSNESSYQNKSYDYYSKYYGFYHYTRYDMEQMLKHKNDKRYKLPKFNSQKVSPVYSAKDDFNDGFKGQQLAVWDAWPVKDQNGNVANFHGYHVVFALSGNPNKATKNYLSGKICVYYQKISDYNKGIKSWHYAGPLFNSNMEGSANKNDNNLKHETGEWSGSAVVQKNGFIRLMYTSFSGSKAYGGLGNNKQSLATASVSIEKLKNRLIINHKKNKDRKIIFSGDGKYYETVEQSTENPNIPSEDDHCLRDPQIVYDNGHKYLIFEANTGQNDGPSGYDSLNNLAYLGGNSKFQRKQTDLFSSNQTISALNSNIPVSLAAAYNNAAIGIVELNNNYTVKKVMKPLVGFNTVEDETERPSIIRYKNTWYLFTIMHGWHMASTNVNSTDSFQLGFSSKKLTSGYKPLNRYGLVIHNSTPMNNKAYTYSYSVNQSNKNPFVITSYMTQLNNAPSLENQPIQYSTFSPSVLLNISGNKTNILKKALKQGQLVYK